MDPQPVCSVSFLERKEEGLGRAEVSNYAPVDIEVIDDPIQEGAMESSNVCQVLLITHNYHHL